MDGYPACLPNHLPRYIYVHATLMFHAHVLLAWQCSMHHAPGHTTTGTATHAGIPSQQRICMAWRSSTQCKYGTSSATHHRVVVSAHDAAGWAARLTQPYLHAASVSPFSFSYPLRSSQGSRTHGLRTHAMRTQAGLLPCPPSARHPIRLWCGPPLC